MMDDRQVLPDTIKHTLNSYRRFRIASNTFDIFAVNLFYGSLISLALMVLSFIVPIENRLILQVTAMIFAVLKAGYISIKQPYTLLKSAIDADIQFELKETLSTTVEFHDKSLDKDIHQKLVDKAVDGSKRIIANSGFKPEANKFAVMGVIALLATVILNTIPNTMDEILANKRELKELSRTTEKQAEQLKKNIDGAKISNKEKEALLQDLEKLLKDLKLATSKEDALAKLNKHQDDLANRLPPTLKRSELALSQLTNTMAQEKGLSQLAKALQSRDADQINNSLNSLNKMLSKNELSKSQQESIAGAMKKAAALMQPLGQTELADTLNSTAQAIDLSSSSQIEQSLTKLSSSLSEQVNNAGLEQAVSSMIAQMEASKNALKGQSQGQTASNTSAGQAGGSKSSGSGSGKGGQGSGSGQGQGQGGSGQGAGQAGAGHGAIGTQGSGSGKSGMKPGLGIVDADRKNQLGEHVALSGSSFINSNGEKIQLSGLHGFGEEIQMGKAGTSRFSSSQSALSPYSNIYADYFNFTAQAINRGEIPKSYEKLVLDYFSQINPNN